MPKRLTETQIERLVELVTDRSAKTADDDLIRWAIDRSPIYVLADALRDAYQELDQIQTATPIKSPGIFATLSANYNSWTLHKVSKTTFTPDLQRGETGKYDPLFRFAEHLQKAKEKGTLYRCRINKGPYHYGTTPGMAAAAAIQAEKEKENEQKQVESSAGGGAVHGQGEAGDSDQADDAQRGGENPTSQTDL